MMKSCHNWLSSVSKKINPEQPFIFINLGLSSVKFGRALMLNMNIKAAVEKNLKLSFVTSKLLLLLNIFSVKECMLHNFNKYYMNCKKS